MTGAPAVKVLYIAGWGRSGSTILTSLLGQVPGVFAGGELRYVWERNLQGGHDCGCGRAFLECDVWREVLERSGATRVEHDMPALLAASAGDRAIPALLTRRGTHGLLDRMGPGVATLRRLYGAIHEVTGSRLIVDSSKVPSYGAFLARVSGLDVRVLHLVRDPRAVAYSWLRKKMQRDVGREMLRRSAFESGWRWAVRNAEVRLFWKTGEARFLRMRYEDVIDRPEMALRRILDFAGEPDARLPFVAPGVAEMQPTHSSSGNPDRFQAGRIELRRDDAWRSGMRRRDRLTVTALTWPQLLSYGYAPRRASGAAG